MADQLPPSLQQIINKKWDGAGDFHREALDPQEHFEAVLRNVQQMSAAIRQSLENLPAPVGLEPAASLLDKAPRVAGASSVQRGPWTTGTAISLRQDLDVWRRESTQGAGMQPAPTATQGTARPAKLLLPWLIAALVLAGFLKCR